MNPLRFLRPLLFVCGSALSFAAVIYVRDICDYLTTLNARVSAKRSALIARDNNIHNEDEHSVIYLFQALLTTINFSNNNALEIFYIPINCW